MKKCLSVLITLIFILSIAGCGPKSRFDGKYTGTEVIFADGSTAPMEEYYPSGESYILISGNIATVCLEGESFECEYMEEENTLTFDLSGETFQAEYSENKLSLDLYGYMTLVFELTD